MIEFEQLKLDVKEISRRDQLRSFESQSHVAAFNHAVTSHKWTASESAAAQGLPLLDAKSPSVVTAWERCNSAAPEFPASRNKDGFPKEPDLQVLMPYFFKPSEIANTVTNTV